MIVEQPCTDLSGAKRNREHIEKMRQKEGHKYVFTNEKDMMTQQRRPFKRGIRGLRG